MENQLPLYLEKHLEDVGVMKDPKLSNQEELENPYTTVFTSFGYEAYAEDEEIKF